MSKKLTKNLYRITCLIFVAALIVAAPVLPERDAHADALSVSDSVVRVYLSSYGTPASITMEASGSHKISDNGKSISGKFTVAVSGGKIKITSGQTVYTLDSDVTIKAGSAKVSNLIKLNGGHSYAGDFRLIVKGSGIKIVNAVDYETYTIGVLPYEMSNGWPMEALKAQAVAARSYAYASANSRARSTQEHDLVNTTQSQVYYGYNAAHTNCIAAVKATSYQILNDKNGNNVHTFFGASNGGHTEYPKSAGVSSSNFAYLPYKTDSYDLAFALGTTAYSAKLTIPKSFKAETLKTSGETVYVMLRGKIASATLNKLTGTVKVKKITLDTPRYTSPNRVFTGADITLTVNDGSAKDIKLSYAPYVDSYGINRPFINDVLKLSDKSKFLMLYLKENDDDYLIASMRYGHGAGMSQIGAYQMTKSGKTYKDILTFYYAMGTESKLVTKSWNINNGITSDATSATPEPPAKISYKYGNVSIVGGGTLNVRSGPSESYSIIGSLANKAAVTIISTSGSWHKIVYKGGTAYVNKNYVKLKSSKTPAAKFKSFKAKVKLSKSSAKLNVRKSPSTSSESLGKLKNGASLTVTGESGSWYKFKYKSKTAYVQKKYIKAVPKFKSFKAKVKLPKGSTELNVRKSPSTSSEILGKLKNGAKLTVTGKSGSWYKFKYKGKTAYVKKSYIVKA
jgi:SpoIID/LytB domain protein